MFWKLIVTFDGTASCYSAISSISLPCVFANPSQKQAYVVILSLDVLHHMLTPSQRLLFLFEFFYFTFISHGCTTKSGTQRSK